MGVTFGEMFCLISHGLEKSKLQFRNFNKNVFLVKMDDTYSFLKNQSYTLNKFNDIIPWQNSIKFNKNLLYRHRVLLGLHLILVLPRNFKTASF